MVCLRYKHAIPIPLEKSGTAPAHFPLRCLVSYTSHRANEIFIHRSPPRSASIQSEAQQLRRGVVETVGSRAHGAFQKMVIKTDCRPAEYSVIKRLAQRVEVLIQKRHTNLYLLKHRKEFDNISCCWCVM